MAVEETTSRIIMAMTAMSEMDVDVVDAILSEIPEPDLLEALELAIMVGHAAVDMWSQETGKTMVECREQLALAYELPEG